MPAGKACPSTARCLPHASGDDLADGHPCDQTAVSVLPPLSSLMKPKLSHYRYWSPNCEAQPCLPFHLQVQPVSQSPQQRLRGTFHPPKKKEKPRT